MYETARRMRIPLLAGSSLPLTWRRPSADVAKGAQLREVVAVSYHTLYGYGFHALEMVQCLAERRRGGETGVARVQCIVGPGVWRAGDEGRFDRSLLTAALKRLENPPSGSLEALTKTPVLFHIQYLDGFQASVFVLNPAVGQWSAAWAENGRE